MISAPDDIIKQTAGCNALQQCTPKRWDAASVPHLGLSSMEGYARVDPPTTTSGGVIRALHPPFQVCRDEVKCAHTVDRHHCGVSIKIGQCLQDVGDCLASSLGLEGVLMRGCGNFNLGSELLGNGSSNESPENVPYNLALLLGVHCARSPRRDLVPN